MHTENFKMFTAQGLSCGFLAAEVKNANCLSQDSSEQINERPFITHLSCIEFFSLVNVLSTGCAPKNIVICKLHEIMLVD